MITAAQAIQTADREGFCQIKQHVWLWKTCEAAASLDVKDIKSPYILITGPHGWENMVRVRTEKNRKLRELCDGKM